MDGCVMPRGIYVPFIWGPLQASPVSASVQPQEPRGCVSPACLNSSTEIAKSVTLSKSVKLNF